MAAGATAEQEAGHGGGGDGSAEWRVDVPAAGEHGSVKGGRSWSWLFLWMAAPRDRVVGFGRMVWKVGADDPRRVVHGLKVALALALCSVFYYVHPLYDFTGGNAMWAVLTVVVVFEYTVGACLYKGLNRAMATVAGGALALGVHWVASQSGKEFQPYVLTGSMFIMAAVATFSRFIPTMKAKFDYGVTVFILTYCLVSVSGYRADEVVYMAQQRLTTIAIGAFICFAVCTFVFPVWAGQELHVLVARNMDKLAASAEGCVEDYFSDATAGEKPARRALSAKSQGYKQVLNAKASEDSLANLAKWEPGHGKFGFRHPYGQYQKVGAAMRCCAYCIDALAASVGSEAQTPADIKKHLAGSCLALSRHLATVLREASGSVTSMTRSDRLGLVVADMNGTAQELRDKLRCLATVLEQGEDETPEAEHELNAVTELATPPLIEALPLFSAASMLLEVCARAELVIGAVETLATTARFKKADHDEKAALDTEAPVPAASTSNPVDAHVSQEIHVKLAGHQERTETAHKAPRDQVGELIKVLMRRGSTKKWARGDTKVSPKPPQDFTVAVPSPRNRAMELAGHGPVVPSPRNRPAELAGHAPAVPTPRNRVVELGGHAPVAPSPRNLASHGGVVPSPRNRSTDFAAHAPSPRNRSILGMA
ncbi:aluminum-activated malate transporter 10-like [Hordeum vulgare]|uniref:Aluminum-activated malate transporter n=1 Tax=Hordeum vulgare subsp. vulgare TaxID=112509 RepID=A0A8I6Z5W5_HORVV|nr:aluminum-activated malate transporter 10-like [Hordeum vulgare subsp. vulgare]KAE8800887.1 aluminum-activated malate transporter 10-like [Hordeum vulgare]KAI4972024.1 hypothetical protein ZWY2020_002949 [Hordeum vulgare]